MIRRSALIALLGVAVVAMLATSAYAVPAPMKFVPRAIDSGSSQAITGGSGLIVGGARNFGTGITSQGGIISVSIGGGRDGGNQIDNYRRAQFVTLAGPAVPEPSTLWLFGAGAAAMLLVSRRARKASR